MENYVFKSFDLLHSIPESGFCEDETSEFIGNELEKIGMKVERGVGGTGIIASYSSGVEGPAVALRADMDALEFTIEGEIVRRHACGHDANSSMVLAACKEIMENGIKKGTFYGVFQPAEELGSGALAMIETGKLSGVDEMFGIHLRPFNEKPLGRATCGLIHNSSYNIEVKVKGRVSHAARPHMGVNAAEAAVIAINSVNAIKMDPGKSFSVKVTKIETGGNALNTIPDRVEMAFDLRAEDNDLMEELLEKCKSAISFGVESVGAKVEGMEVSGIPAAEYSDELIEVARRSITEVLGECDDPQMTSGGEDFHFYNKVLGIKTAYVGLGADLKPGLHDPDMTFDKKALIDGKEILKKIVISRLG
ncbi:amidohydrolase [Psychrilyobacter sp.]|uniref:amidohydrolase n=1 Tax=Psychrilyobacter sp. TaxID=2586924 RepID=UPI00301ADBC5